MTSLMSLVSLYSNPNTHLSTFHSLTNQMGLSPLFRTSDSGEVVTQVRANRHAQSAVTQYRVLDSTNGCSLVELQAVTCELAIWVSSFAKITFKWITEQHLLHCIKAIWATSANT